MSPCLFNPWGLLCRNVCFGVIRWTWWDKKLLISFLVVHHSVPRLPQQWGHSPYMKSAPLQSPSRMNWWRPRASLQYTREIQVSTMQWPPLSCLFIRYQTRLKFFINVTSYKLELVLAQNMKNSGLNNDEKSAGRLLHWYGRSYQFFPLLPLGCGFHLHANKIAVEFQPSCLTSN